MIYIILSLLIGLVFGYYSKKDFKNIVNKSYIIVVSLLLFFMGVAIGNNETIFNNIASIGLISFSLAFFGIIGSIIAVKIAEGVL